MRRHHSAVFRRANGAFLPRYAARLVHISSRILARAFVDLDTEEQAIIIRFSYPALLLAVFCVLYIKWQWEKLCVIAQKIRDDKFLVGTQLVNFYRESRSTPRAEK